MKKHVSPKRISVAVFPNSIFLLFGFNFHNSLVLLSSLGNLHVFSLISIIQALPRNSYLAIAAMQTIALLLQADLRDTEGLAPDHCDEVRIAIN